MDVEDRVSATDADPVIREGQLYETLEDIPVLCITVYAAPFSGGHDRILPRGERFRILKDPGEKSEEVDCKPLRYRRLHAQMVPRSERWHLFYSHYVLCVKIDEIRESCRLIEGAK